MAGVRVVEMEEPISRGKKFKVEETDDRSGNHWAAKKIRFVTQKTDWPGLKISSEGLKSCGIVRRCRCADSKCTEKAWSVGLDWSIMRNEISGWVAVREPWAEGEENGGDCRVRGELGVRGDDSGSGSVSGG